MEEIMISGWMDELNALVEENKECINAQESIQALLHTVEACCAKREDTCFSFEMWAYEVYIARYGDPLDKADRTDCEETFCMQREMLKLGGETMLSREACKAFLTELIVRNELFALSQMSNDELAEALADHTKHGRLGRWHEIPMLAFREAMIKRLGYTDYGMIMKLQK